MRKYILHMHICILYTIYIGLKTVSISIVYAMPVCWCVCVAIVYAFSMFDDRRVASSIRDVSKTFIIICLVFLCTYRQNGKILSIFWWHNYPPNELSPNTAYHSTISSTFKLQHLRQEEHAATTGFRVQSTTRTKNKTKKTLTSTLLWHVYSNRNN